MLYALMMLALASIGLWLATDTVIDAVRRLSTRARLSATGRMLFFFGIVSSLPELAIIINAVWLRAPQIALGNLVGTQFFLLFVLIPVLAILTRGIHLDGRRQLGPLLLTLTLIGIAILSLHDQVIGMIELGSIAILYLLFVLASLRSFPDRDHAHQALLVGTSGSPVYELGKIGICIGLILLSANVAVRQIIEIAALLHSPRFLLSMFLLPLATNFSELGFAIHAKRKTMAIALSDFMGTLAANAILIVCLVAIWGSAITIDQAIWPVIGLFVSGLVVFFFLAMSKKLLSVGEGLFLFLFAIAFGGLVVMLDWQQKLQLFFAR